MIHLDKVAFLAAVILILTASPVTLADLPDQAITDAVEDHLKQDCLIDCAAIDVSTSKGIVTLTGRTRTLASRMRAVAAAEMIRGVRTVIDNTKVVPPAGRADTVQKDLERALLFDPATAKLSINVAATRGAVTLTGKVQSLQQKELAGAVAASVAGVIQVANAIQVDRQNASDQQIEAEIRQALLQDMLIDHGMVEVKVKKGHARLSARWPAPPRADAQGKMHRSSESQASMAPRWRCAAGRAQRNFDRANTCPELSPSCNRRPKKPWR